MKKLWLRIFALCLVAMLFTTAAIADVSAIATDTLFFRTGPNTKYAGDFSAPQSTHIVAIERDEGNGTTWVLVEFMLDGELQRAYTGLKRMNVLGTLPWASYIGYASTAVIGDTVYAGPGSYYKVRGRLGDGEKVILLNYDGDYAYVEFYDAASKALSRGYVESWLLDSTTYYDGSAMFCPGATINSACTVYSRPGSGSSMGKVGVNEVVSYIGYQSGYALIEFYSSASHGGRQGWIPMSCLTEFGY